MRPRRSFRISDARDGNSRTEEGVIRILAYWKTPPPGLADELRARLAGTASRLHATTPRIAQPETVPEEDWEASWRRHFTTERPLPGLVIRPSWIACDPAPGEEVIVIDPKMAFGVGSHPTTALSLRFLRGLCAGARVLDVGTGTGILAIAAARWGAREVVAVDTDPAAVENALESVRRNREARRVRILRGSAAEAAGTFDVAVANLLSSELARVMPSLPRGWRRAATLIVSGFLREEEGAIRALIEERGFRPRPGSGRGNGAPSARGGIRFILHEAVIGRLHARRELALERGVVDPMGDVREERPLGPRRGDGGQGVRHGEVRRVRLVAEGVDDQEIDLSDRLHPPPPDCSVKRRPRRRSDAWPPCAAPRTGTPSSRARAVLHLERRGLEPDHFEGPVHLDELELWHRARVTALEDVGERRAQALHRVLHRVDWHRAVLQEIERPQIVQPGDADRRGRACTARRPNAARWRGASGSELGPGVDHQGASAVLEEGGGPEAVVAGVGGTADLAGAADDGTPMEVPLPRMVTRMARAYQRPRPETSGHGRARCAAPGTAGWMGGGNRATCSQGLLTRVSIAARVTRASPSRPLARRSCARGRHAMRQTPPAALPWARGKRRPEP